MRAFDLSLLVARLFRDKRINDIPLRVRKDAPDFKDLKRVIQGLCERELLERLNSDRFDGLYIRPGSELSVSQIVCFMDPVCYISHLSAMEWHGITGRRQKSVQISSPRGTRWSRLIDTRMAQELTTSPWLGPNGANEIAPVQGTYAWRHFRHRILGRHVVRHEDSHWEEANYLTTDDDVRISTIGRTYFDMIRQPNRCGGIQHVLECFEEHALRHRNAIMREVNTHGSKLDKSRVGYILDERLGMRSTPTLEHWLETAIQRGGSRKLDAEAEYSSEYSERWCLSLNV